ncbi:unnamed protein product [Trifolium pratense]|uniref:Uncharacterized protein n=1 Tax=Trifolium pratense TaxID=57577 RepID=A0ACB0MDV6_TRIPR|nr:unnamed protein product [Trifolium pratense]
MGVFTLFHREADPDAKDNCKFPSQHLLLASAIVNSKDLNTHNIFSTKTNLVLCKFLEVKFLICRLFFTFFV